MGCVGVTLYLLEHYSGYGGLHRANGQDLVNFMRALLRSLEFRCSLENLVLVGVGRRSSIKGEFYFLYLCCYYRSDDEPSYVSWWNKRGLMLDSVWWSDLGLCGCVERCGRPIGAR